jgi:hypothetical protein
MMGVILTGVMEMEMVRGEWQEQQGATWVGEGGPPLQPLGKEKEV